jgi:hypothetical protein
VDDEVRTQRITEVDISHGRIRVPNRHKHLFPASRTRLAVRVLGQSLRDVAWDPRLGPDQERSGILYVGRQAIGQIVPDEVLKIRVENGTVELRRVS